MLGIIYAVIVSLLGAIEKILFRFVVKTNSSFGFHFLWAFFSGLFLLPVFIFEFVNNNNSFPIIDNGILPWSLLIISGLLWTGAGCFGFLAYKYMHVSLKSPISKIKILFVLILSVIFLEESITVEKILGTLFIFFGVIFINYKKNGKIKDFFDKGTIFTIIAALLMAITLLVDKVATSYFASGTYGFLVFLMTPIILLPFIIKRRFKETKKLVKKNLLPIIISALIGGVSYYLILEAFRIEEASVIIPILEISTFITVIGGIIFLKETEKIWQKIVMSVLIIVGVLLIGGIIKLF